MDSNNIDSSNQTIIPPPKDFWEMLAGEKILYKAKASGAYFNALLGILATSFCLFGIIGVCSSSFGKTLSERLFSVLAIALLATLSFLFLRYSYRELRFFFGTRYLATPTRLLIGIDLPWEGPKFKVIVYWKDVTAICKSERTKRTYIFLLNKNIMLRDREQNFNENLYSIWQQSLICSENEDSNSIDSSNKLNISLPKDIWEALAGERILYKTKAIGADFVSFMGELAGSWILLSLIPIILAILFAECNKLFLILFCLLLATISYFLLRYRSREREFSFGTYLATPTRLLIGIELPEHDPKTKVIVYWKDVTTIYQKKRTYICLSNDKRIMLREKEPNTYENLYTVWQQSRLLS